MNDRATNSDKKFAYSTTNVATFQPLAIDIVLFDALSQVLADVFAASKNPIRLDDKTKKFSLFWEPFSTYQSLQRAHVGYRLGADDESYQFARDEFENARLFRNALEYIAREGRSATAINRSPESGYKVNTLLSIRDTAKDTKSVLDLLKSSLKDVVNARCNLVDIYKSDGVNKSDLIKKSEKELNTEKANLENVNLSVMTWLEDVKPESVIAEALWKKYTRLLEHRAVASPLGLLHHYRQHFFYGELERGGIELVKSLAPHEEFEVILTESRSSTVEEEILNELEVTTNSSVEEKASIELTDRVASTISRSSTMNISANGSYTAVFWNAGGSVSSTTSEASVNSNESTTKRLQEVTKKQSEQTRKLTRITTRRSETRNESATNRHLIRNDSNDPVTYGLRKLGNTVHSKIQSLGEQLVWQTKVFDPGRFLALSNFLDLEYAPEKVEIVGWETVRVTLNHSHDRYIPKQKQVVDVAEVFISAFKKHMEQYKSLQGHEVYKKVEKWFYSGQHISEIDPNITKPTAPWKGTTFQNLLFQHIGHNAQGHFGPSREDPRPRKDPSWLKGADKLEIQPGGITTELDFSIVIPWANFWIDGTIQLPRLGVTQLSLIPPGIELPEGLKDENGKITASKEAQDAYLQHMISISEIKASVDINSDQKRRIADLRFEERKSILAQKISTLMDGVGYSEEDKNSILNMYVRINDIFDGQQLFYDVDTSEYAEAKHLRSHPIGNRDAYNIVSTANNAVHLGASLGWTRVQKDGDEKRNMFLNAPFAWACLPVRPGREADAVDFLRSHGLIAGETAVLSEMLQRFRVVQTAERLLADELRDDRGVYDQQVTGQHEVRKWVADYLRIKDAKALEDALLKAKGDKSVSASNLYPVISSLNSFAAIDGLAYERIDMGTNAVGVGIRETPEPAEHVAANSAKGMTTRNWSIVAAISSLFALVLLAALIWKS